MVYPDKKAMTKQTDAEAKQQLRAQQPDATVDPQKLLGPGYAGALNPGPETSEAPLPFLRDQTLGATDLRHRLATAPEDERLRLMNDIVSLAPWEAVWDLVTPQQLQQDLDRLELPDGLRQAWHRWLTIQSERRGPAASGSA